MSIETLMEQNQENYNQYEDGLITRAEFLLLLHNRISKIIQQDIQEYKNSLNVYGINVGKRIIGKLKFTYKVDYFDADNFIITSDEIEAIANNYNTTNGITKSKQESLIKTREIATKNCSKFSATSFELSLKDITTIQ